MRTTGNTGEVLDWPLGSGGGFSLVILGLALGDASVGGMDAVLGLEFAAS